MLDLNVLLDKKKFRSDDHKDGVLRGFRKLEEDELGSLEEKQGRTNSKVRTWLISQTLNNSVHYTCRLTSSVREDFQRGMMRRRRLR